MRVAETTIGSRVTTVCARALVAVSAARPARVRIVMRPRRRECRRRMLGRRGGAGLVEALIMSEMVTGRRGAVKPWSRAQKKRAPLLATLHSRIGGPGP